MKKTIITVLCLFVFATTFSACGKTECDLCGEQSNCSTKVVFGEEISVCKDCIEELYDF